MNHHATIGGIFSILSGTLGVLGGIGLAVFFIGFFRFIVAVEGFETATDVTGEEALNILAVVYGAMGLFLALLGAVGIVGGAYALKRRLWGLALAGAIASAMIFLPFGVVAVIFTALGRTEFTAPSPDPEFGLQPPAQTAT